MIKTTVDLDEGLLEKAVSIFKGKTRKEIISIALTELVERHEQKDLYDLFDGGESLIAEDYDYKAMRGGSISDIS
ncbi:MAG: type II toxin-antitoxin system VapB family antitoxin [Oscillospiraceae bacterium]|nr:type II toxin-antitoxin system VapB family antitoxin [Oscillospiraceae bacterium]